MPRYIYGIRPVGEALREQKVTALHVAQGDNGPALRNMSQEAQAAGIPVRVVPRAELDEMSSGRPHQGVVATASEFSYVQLQDLLEHPAGSAALVLVLDSVQDPQNLGALIRTANVVGLDGVVLPKDRAAHVTPAVVKASAGATEHTRIAQVTNIARALEEIREAQLWIVGTAVDGKQAPWQVDFKMPTAIVLGSEGKGMRPLVQKQCDVLVRIPMAGQVESLNVSAAGAILMYEALRQRSAG